MASDDFVVRAGGEVKQLSANGRGCGLGGTAGMNITDDSYAVVGFGARKCPFAAYEQAAEGTGKVPASVRAKTSPNPGLLLPLGYPEPGYL